MLIFDMQPYFDPTRKTMENNLNFLGKTRMTTSNGKKMEDNLKKKWMTTSLKKCKTTSKKMKWKKPQFF
jgi:hypothetical protein